MKSPDPNYRDLEGTEFEKPVVTTPLDTALGRVISTSVLMTGIMSSCVVLEHTLAPIPMVLSVVLYFLFVGAPFGHLMGVLGQEAIETFFSLIDKVHHRYVKGDDDGEPGEHR